MGYARELAELASAYNTGSPLTHRNKIINGAMEINQRGSSSYTANGYTLDRWTLFNSGGTFAASQQSYANGSKPAFGLKNFLRVTRTSPSSILYITQKIEDVSFYDNIDITVSFYAKATGAVTLPSRVMQEFGSGGSASVTVGSVNHSLTTTLQRFTATFTCPSLSGKTIGTSSYFELTFDMPATTETIEISGVQLEAGRVATPFEMRQYGAELALCQRYYQKASAYNGIAGSSATVNGVVPFSVVMRAAPTLGQIGTFGLSDGYAADVTQSSVSSSLLGANEYSAFATLLNYSGLTTGRPYLGQRFNTSGVLTFSAEL